MDIAPTKQPPSVSVEGNTAGTASPNPLTAAEEALAKDGAQSQAAPTLSPPAAALEAIAATIWHIDKRIIALWAINENRNSWIGTNDAGWKKLANNSDTAIVALTVLGSHARDSGTRVDYREEGDGMVHEMYVW
jgi:hypothetical protein